MQVRATVAIAAVLFLAFVAAQPRAQSAAITYYIADGAGHPGFRSGDRELAEWALGAWRSAATGMRMEPAKESEALIRVYWVEPNMGRYGEMQPLIVNGRRGGAVFIQADVNLLGQDISRIANRDELFRDTVVYLTCVHEIGHALGLAHTADFRDIMYYFGFGGDIIDYFNRYRTQLTGRADIAKASGLSEADRRRLVAIYPVPSKEF